MAIVATDGQEPDAPPPPWLLAQAETLILAAATGEDEKTRMLGELDGVQTQDELDGLMARALDLQPARFPGQVPRRDDQLTLRLLREP